MKKVFFRSQAVKELIRFCIVGMIATGIDAAIFYLFKSFTSYRYSLVAGYLVSLIFNYLMTVYWTFSVKSNARHFVGIISVHLLNLFVIRMGLMYFFINIMGLTDSVAYLPMLLISTAASFSMVRYVIKN